MADWVQVFYENDPKTPFYVNLELAIKIKPNTTGTTIAFSDGSLEYVAGSPDDLLAMANEPRGG